MTRVLYFTIATSFFAAQVFTIDLKFFQLSLFRLAIIIAPVLLVLYGLKSSKEIYLLPNGRNRYSIQFMLIWLLYSFLSILWVKDIGLAIRSIYFIIAGVICIVLFSIFLKEKKHFLISFNVLQFMVVMHNLIGWYEIITRDYRFMSIDNIEYYSSIKEGIPVSMLGNPNDYATLMLFGIFIAYICLHLNRSIIAKIISLGLLVSSTTLVFITNSRANIIGLLIAFILYFLLKKKGRIAFSIGFILLIFLSLLTLGNDLHQALILSLNKDFNFSFNTEDLNSEGTRLNLIKNGLYFLVSTYGFGTGAGNIEYWMQYRAIFPTRFVTNIHNWWMEILTGYGAIIFFLYIKFYVRLFKDLYKIYKFTNDSFDKTIALGILACMAGFIIASVSSSSNIAKEWLWVFWAIAIAFQGYAGRKIINNQNK